MSVVNSLLEKSSIINYSKKYYAFFSRSGYAKNVRKFAESSKNIFLYKLEDFTEVI